MELRKVNMPRKLSYKVKLKDLQSIGTLIKLDN